MTPKRTLSSRAFRGQVGIDFQEVSFGIDKEQRAVPPTLIARRLEHLDATGRQFFIAFIDLFVADANPQLTRRLLDAPVVRPSVKRPQDQSRPPDLELDPVGAFVGNRKAHHMVIECSRRLDIAAVQDDISEP